MRRTRQQYNGLEGPSIAILLFDFVANHTTNRSATNCASRTTSGQNRTTEGADTGSYCSILALF
jgi:hypothetical protein